MRFSLPILPMLPIFLLTLTALMTPACSKRLEPTLTLESREERMRLLRTALTIEHKPNQLHAIADETLSRVHAALINEDLATVADIIDLGAMGRLSDARSATAAQVAPTLSDSDFQAGLLSTLFGESNDRWASHTIRYVLPIGVESAVADDVPPGDVRRLRELLVVSTHRHADGDVSHMRWWLGRLADSPWKVYDLEFSDLVARLSYDLAIIIRADLNKSSWVDQAQALDAAVSNLEAGDLAEVRRVVDRIDWLNFPVSLRARYLLKRADLEEAEGHLETALATVDLAAGVHEDAKTMRALLVHRLSLLESLGRHQDVLATASQIEALYGKDDIVRDFRAFALEAIEKSPSPEPPQPTPR